MLKFKEGKMMIANLFVMIAIVAVSVLAVPYYGTKTVYTLFLYLLAVSIVVLSTLQILLSKKLYAIAKEEDVKTSKIETRDE